MLFSSFQIKGKGRGRKLGVPTINLQIPPEFKLEEGIYAAWVFIDGESYRGALHFGPVPVFNELRRSLEVHLLDVLELPQTMDQRIKVRVVQKIREIQNFPSPEAMIERIQKDIEEALKILKTPS